MGIISKAEIENGTGWMMRKEERKQRKEEKEEKEKVDNPTQNKRGPSPSFKSKSNHHYASLHHTMSTPLASLTHIHSVYMCVLLLSLKGDNALTPCHMSCPHKNRRH